MDVTTAAQPFASLQAALADPPALLRHLYAVAVQRALPLHHMAAHLPPPPRGRTLVLGAGKAAGAMAQALEALWPPDAPLSGLVVTRYGHTPARPAHLRQRVEVAHAAHPVPDEAGVQAAQRMLALAAGEGPGGPLTADDLVLCLISGGGSALLTLPQPPLTLADKQRISRQLLACGAGIGEMNTVRKHLSAIKGGRLAAACAPARVLTLAISDVPGDDPAVIASGPTVADASTCAQALEILQRHAIQVPPAVLDALRSGAWETPKQNPNQAPDQAPNQSTPTASGGAAHSGEVRLVATPLQSLHAAAQAARALGLQAFVLSDEIEGESRDVGRVHAALARAAAKGVGPWPKPCVILSGGETTVTLPARSQAQASPAAGIPAVGSGGRAAEFCMGLALGLQGQPGVWGLAADTDGIDGVSDSAGAVVSPDSLARAQRLGLSVADHLQRHDGHSLFAALGDGVTTGPTHTNVNDFRALLVL